MPCSVQPSAGAFKGVMRLRMMSPLSKRPWMDASPSTSWAHNKNTAFYEPWRASADTHLLGTGQWISQPTETNYPVCRIFVKLLQMKKTSFLNRVKSPLKRDVLIRGQQTVLFIYKSQTQVRWWHTSVIPALRRQSQTIFLSSRSPWSTYRVLGQPGLPKEKEGVCVSLVWWISPVILAS